MRTGVRPLVVSILLGSLASLGVSLPLHAAPLPAAGARPPVPRVFVENAGQWPSEVRYSMYGAGYGVFFTEHDTRFALPDGRGQAFPVSLVFRGASPSVRLTGGRPETGRVNLLVGDRARWRTNLVAYGEMVYHEVWPGIDASFAGSGGALKYEYRVAPGADPGRIRLRYRGATRVSKSADGGLDIETRAGVLHDAAPVSYQEIAGRRVAVRTALVLDRGDISIVVGPYRRSAPLIIDPGIVFSTYVGGQFEEQMGGVALDSEQNVYIGGYTNSPDFPTTGAPSAVYQTYFVTKLDPTGSRLVYSTLLPIGAPNLAAIGQGLAVDAAGNAYLTGTTNADPSPTASFGPFSNAGAAFVAKLDPSGSTLLYNVVVGGSYSTEAIALALDRTSAVYVTGRTSSADYPTTPAAFDATFGGGDAGCCAPYDAFVFKLDPTGRTLAYSSFLGGGPGVLNGQDEGRAIAVDLTGSAYVTGTTGSSDFPTTPGAYRTSVNGYPVVFVTKFNPQGSALTYSTVVASGGIEIARAIAVDEAGRAYVVGTAYRSKMPTTANAVQPTVPSPDNYSGFLLKFDATGSSVVYGTYLGGTAYSDAKAIAVDAHDRAYVTGLGSAGFPVTPNAPIQVAPPGDSAGVMAVVDTESGGLVYGTYMPATSPAAIEIDPRGDAWVAGTAGSGMMTTPNAFQKAVGTSANAPQDAFVARIVPATDLAWRRPATSSTNENGALGPGNAVDGDFTTRWSSQFSDPQWIAVDLGVVSALTRVVLHWETAYSSSYQIQVSRDGVTWTTAASRAGGGGIDDVALAETARYVRIYSLGRGTPWGVSLWELEAYGTPSGGSNVPPAVAITSPANNAAFSSGAQVALSATASDPDGSVARVDYYANGTMVGTSAAAPYRVTWGDVVTGNYSLTAVATDNLGAKTASAAVNITVQPISGSDSPWPHQDVGAVGVAGSVSYNSATGAYTVKAAGADIWDSADAFHFVYQPLTGDGQIIARITGIQNTDTYAKAGVMIRESLAANAAHVLADIKPNSGYEVLQRYATGGSTWVASSGVITSPPPTWLKLVRSGQTVVAHVSINGGSGTSDWTYLGSANITMGPSVYIGLAVTSHDTSVLNTSMFDNVSVTVGVPPSGSTLPSPWVSGDVGTVGVKGTATYGAGVFRVAGAGADIWGTADGFQYVSQTAGGDTQIVARVTSLQNTDTFAKAGVMLRESTAANSRHVVLDVRPGGGVEFMTRSASGGSTAYVAGTSVSLPVWLRLARSGSTVVGSVSYDGKSWTSVGTVATSIASSASVGLAVTSHDTTLLDTSTFDNVSVATGSAPPLTSAAANNRN